MHINENSKVVLLTVTVIAAVMVIEMKTNPILPLYKKKEFSFADSGLCSSSEAGSENLVGISRHVI